jgi:hypothetical protein
MLWRGDCQELGCSDVSGGVLLASCSMMVTGRFGLLLARYQAWVAPVSGPMGSEVGAGVALFCDRHRALSVMGGRWGGRFVVLWVSCMVPHFVWSTRALFGAYAMHQTLVKKALRAVGLLRAVPIRTLPEY